MAESLQDELPTLAGELFLGVRADTSPFEKDLTDGSKRAVDGAKAEVEKLPTAVGQAGERSGTEFHRAFTAKLPAVGTDTVKAIEKAGNEAGERGGKAAAGKFGSVFGQAFKGAQGAISEAGGDMEGTLGRVGGAGLEAAAEETGIGAIAVAAVLGAKKLVEMGDVWRDMKDDFILDTGATGDQGDAFTANVSRLSRGLADSTQDVAKVATEVSRVKGLTDDARDELTKDISTYNDKTPDDPLNTKAFIETMRVFDVPADQYAEHLNELYSLHQATGQSLNVLVGEMGKAGPAAKLLGENFGQSANLLDVFEQAGIPANTAMTTLRTTVGLLTKDAKPLKDAMGGTAFAPSASVNQRLGEVVTKIHELSNGTAEQRIEADKLGEAAFGPKGWPAIASAIGDNKINVDQLKSTLDTVPDSINKSAEATDHLKDQTAQWEHQIGDDLKPVTDWASRTWEEFCGGLIKDFADVVSGVKDGWNSMFDHSTMPAPTPGRAGIPPADQGPAPGSEAEHRGKTGQLPAAGPDQYAAPGAQRARRGADDPVYVPPPDSGPADIPDSSEPKHSGGGGGGGTRTVGASSSDDDHSDDRGKTVPLVQNADGSWTSPDPAWRHLITRESGGNATIRQGNIGDVNNRTGDLALGLFQITTATWRGNGGQEFAPNAAAASPEDQAIVAARIFAARGGQPWGAGLPGRESAAELRSGLVSSDKQGRSATGTSDDPIHTRSVDDKKDSGKGGSDSGGFLSGLMQELGLDGSVFGTDPSQWGIVKLFTGLFGDLNKIGDSYDFSKATPQSKADANAALPGIIGKAFQFPTAEDAAVPAASTTDANSPAGIAAALVTPPDGGPPGPRGDAPGPPTVGTQDNSTTTNNTTIFNTPQAVTPPASAGSRPG